MMDYSRLLTGGKKCTPSSASGSFFLHVSSRVSHCLWKITVQCLGHHFLLIFRTLLYDRLRLVSNKT